MKFVKLFVLMFLILLLIGSVSATNFGIDDYKEVSPDEKVITIYDSSLMGEDTKLAEFELKTNHIEQVGLGYQKVAEFTIENSYEDVAKMIEGFEFYNIKDGMKSVEIDYDLKYKTITLDKGITKSCETDNKTLAKACIDIPYEREVETWNDYSPKTMLKDEKITLGVFTTTKQGDRIEWIPTLYGIEIDEWASWDAGLNVGLVEYWNFEEGTGTNVEGSLGRYNLTSNSTTWLAGKVGSYGMNFSSDNFEMARTTDNVIQIVGTDYTINGWIKLNTETDQSSVWKVGENINTLAGKAHLLYGSLNGISTDKWIVNIPNTESLVGSSTNADVGVYRMMTVQYKVATNNLSLWKNGDLDGYVITTFDPTVGEFWLGFGLPNGQPAKGRFVGDEISIWNRSLSEAEIIQLYNSDAGMTIVGPPTINLNSPVNTANLTDANVKFNCTATGTGTLSNVSLIINGTYNNTNATVTSGVAVINTVTLADGYYNWTCEGCDENGCANATERIFTLDTTPPLILINSGNESATYGNLSTNHTINFTVTDANLDTCILEYYGTNTTIEGCLTGVLNSTNFTIIPGFYNATIYANDTFGYWTSEYLEWDYRILELAQTYVTPVLEGTTNIFLVNVSANASITAGYLYYNETAYLGTISSIGDIYTVQRDQVALFVDTSTNASFYWSLTTADEVDYNFTAANQTVNPFIVNATCTGMYVIYNFTMLDELTQANLNAAASNTLIKVDMHIYTSDRATEIYHYYGSLNETNPVAICMDSNLSDGSIYSIDIQIEYDATDYANEMYYIEDYNLNESSMNQSLNLYDLLDASAQDFKLMVRDTAYLPLEGVLVEIHRKYIENGTFHIVELPKTDARGIATASLELNDAIYNFYVYDDGTLVESFLNVNAICQTPAISTCEIDFNAFASEVVVPDYESDIDFEYTLGYNKTSRVISSIFTIPSGIPAVVLLNITQEDSLGTFVCTDTLTSASGTLSCAVPVAFGNSTVLAKLYKSSNEIAKGNIKLDQDPDDLYGGILIFLSIFVMLSLIGAGISDNPVFTILFLMLGVILLFALNLVANNGFIGGSATILWFLVALVLILIKAAKRN